MELISFPVSTLAYILALIVVLSAAGVDLATRRIPNGFTITIGLLGLGFAIGVGGLPGLIVALAGFAVTFGLLLPGYLLGFTGGGDLKLMAGLGCILGPKLSLHAMLLYYLISAFLALLFAVYATYFLGCSGPFARYRAMACTLFTSGRFVYIRPSVRESMGARLPMAPAIALATIMAPLL
ncbi:MAG: A24 family peptidase [Lamprobacter sp.]|uniref:A24 family peptidase n=1 Tax=Lamprobacter sp. TaxID=3100796 RepID=UPI002B2617A6|nr:A24 family peptidase [Lamprobacter sp.]MEA3640839.1 A24 family peptidase [Lamprobacter sp.]